MKLAIMQPYFMPYIGYFSLIKKVDEFMLFDTPQFMRKGWIERNRIAKLGGGESYIKVPLIKASLNTPINEMFINNDINWKDKILSQLQIYKKRSPYYKDVIDVIDASIIINKEKISELNRHSLQVICDYLGVDTKISVFSDYSFSKEINNISPDEWALEICKKKKCYSYINAIGGKDFFDTDKYISNGIDIKFIEHENIEYRGLEGEINSNLSILDILMYNSPEEINKMLDNSRLIK